MKKEISNRDTPCKGTRLSALFHTTAVIVEYRDTTLNLTNVNGPQLPVYFKNQHHILI